MKLVKKHVIGIVCFSILAVCIIVVAVGMHTGRGVGGAVPTPTASFKGRIIDEHGEGITGASMTLYRKQGGSFPDVQYELIETTRSGSDGVVILNADANSSEQWFLLLARVAGRSIGWKYWRAADGEFDIHLGPPSVLGGKILDENGRPVVRADVSLLLQAEGNGALYGNGIALLATRTDEGGAFAFSEVPVGCTGHLQAIGSGKAIVDTLYDLSSYGGYKAPRSDIELRLSPASEVNVRLHCKDGGSPGSLEITAMPSMTRPSKAQCLSKEGGLYQLAQLPRGSCRIEVNSVSSQPPFWTCSPLSVSPVPEKPITVDADLVPGGLVEMELQDERGSPISSGKIELRNARQDWKITRGPDDDGKFRFRLVPGGYEVTAARTGSYQLPRSSTQAFILGPNEVRKATIGLVDTSPIRGKALDPGGKPLPGARLCLLPGTRWGRADRDGGFSLPHPLRPCRWLLVNDENSGSVTLRSEPSNSESLEVKLSVGAGLRGTVLDQSERPVPSARVSVLLDDEAQPVETPLQAATEEDGTFRIDRLPMGEGIILRVSAPGFCARDVQVSAGSGDQEMAPIVLQSFLRSGSQPTFNRVSIPTFPGSWAIWGSTGRDSRGHVWFGVCATEAEHASARLFEFAPDTGEVVCRGDVISELKRLGLCRDGESQNKIHTRIVQVGDYLYFASMDEKGRTESGLLPVWGSHLWRLRLKDNTWEHLFSAPEGLIAVSASGHLVYSLGLWSHKLYQYDPNTGEIQFLEVGSAPGHVSRNFLTDRRDHAYVPRVRLGVDGKQPSVELVEFDESLHEVKSTPLKYYWTGDRETHGITAHQLLHDGSIAFLTHTGRLYRLRPAEGAPASLDDIGWLHPDGPCCAATLFLDSSGQSLLSAVERGGEERYEWLRYDLSTGRRVLASLKPPSVEARSLKSAWIFGSETKDDFGSLYLVGVESETGSGKPILLRVQLTPSQ